MAIFLAAVSAREEATNKKSPFSKGGFRGILTWLSCLLLSYRLIPAPGEMLLYHLDYSKPET
jgi:hypothetical protein